MENPKQALIDAILTIVVAVNAVEIDGRANLTREDILGPSRTELASTARCMAIDLLVSSGFTVNTPAQLFHRSVPAIRHMLVKSRDLYDTNRLYRVTAQRAHTLLRQSRTGAA